MAKIECSIDTGDRSIEVKVDGKKIDNFGYMSVYGSKSPYGYMFNMASIEEMEDLNKTTYWSHSHQIGEIEDFLRGLGKEAKSNKDMDEDMEDEDMEDEDMDEEQMKKNKKKSMKSKDKK